MLRHCSDGGKVHSRIDGRELAGLHQQAGGGEGGQSGAAVRVGGVRSSGPVFEYKSGLVEARTS